MDLKEGKEVLAALRSAQADFELALRKENVDLLLQVLPSLKREFYRYVMVFRGETPEEVRIWLEGLPEEVKSAIEAAALSSHVELLRNPAVVSFIRSFNEGDPEVAISMILLASLGTDLFTAVTRGNLQEIENLILAGENPNAQMANFARDQGAEFVQGGSTEFDGGAPLHVAAGLGLSKPIKVLVRHGANPEIRNRMGGTPLHVAAEARAIDAVMMLLRVGANPNAYDKRGVRPLHIAVATGHLKVVEALVRANADVLAVMEDGMTPLDLALRMGSTPIIACLQGRA